MFAFVKTDFDRVATLANESCAKSHSLRLVSTRDALSKMVPDDSLHLFRLALAKLLSEKLTRSNEAPTNTAEVRSDRVKFVPDRIAAEKSVC